MTQNLKALIVVLGLALIVFALAKPLALRYTSVETFARRRNVWLFLTVVAFVSPSLWWYALAAFPTLFWLGKKDPNPFAVYVLMLHVAPPMSIDIPMLGINNLFALSNFRILSISLLMPVAASMIATSGRMMWSRFLHFDMLVIGYGVLQLALLVPYETITNTMRRGFLFLIDAIIIYLVVSRLAVDRRKAVDAMASLVLAAAIMAAVAAFEHFKGWLLYVNINEIWGDPNEFAWLLRGNDLRAQGPTGHAIVLGYVLAMALAFWLYLQRAIDSATVRVSVHVLLWIGLFVTISRGPWIVAAVAYVMFYLLISRQVGRQPLRFAVVAVGLGVIAMTPFGSQIIEKLPFIGTTETDTVDYRQQLAETSWLLIQQNPFFGNPFVTQQLESLRQGQGIIDLVNSYATIAMFYGLVGLALFLGTYVLALLACLRWTLAARRVGGADVSFGAVLIACLTATLVMIGTVSLVHVIPIFYWMLAGLGTAFAVRMRASESVTSVGLSPGRVATD